MKSLILLCCLMVTVHGLLETVSVFGPRINEVHYFISDLQNETRSHGTEVLNNLSKALSDYITALQTHLVELTSEIRELVRDIIAENGMNEHLEEIKHCLDEESVLVGDMTNYFLGGRDLAVAQGRHQFVGAGMFVNTIFLTLGEEHGILANRTNECVQIPTEYETVQCCVELLYERQAIRQKELRDAVDNWTRTLDDTLPNYNSSMATIYELMLNTTQPFVQTITDVFRKCVIEAKPMLETDNV